MSGLFEHLAATDDSERVAARQAVAVAHKRVKDYLGGFISHALNEEETKARLALVDEDVAQIVAETVDEYGGDHDNVLAAIRERVAAPLAPLDETGTHPGYWDSPVGGNCPNCGASSDPHSSSCENCGIPLTGSGAMEPNEYRELQNAHRPPALNPSQFDEEGVHPLESQYFRSGPELYDPNHRRLTHEARRPKMCPYHSELVDASLQAGDPQYAAFSGLVGGPSHCKGGFDGACNFKPEMVTPEFWDAKKAEADERRLMREKELTAPEPVNPIDQAPADEGFGVTDLDQELSEAPSAVAEPELSEHFDAEPAMALASAHTAEADRDGGGAVRREDLPNRTDDHSTKPSPKIDKSEWKPNALGDGSNVKPIDSEMEGSPHPTERIDITEPLLAQRDGDFLDQTDAVTESQDLPSANDDGYSTERNISGQDSQSDTWHSTDGLASPVTDKVFSSAQDPHKNPIRDILEGGFAPDSQVQSALAKFRASQKG